VEYTRNFDGTLAGNVNDKIGEDRPEKDGIVSKVLTLVARARS
jgi:hypothetical protein